MKTRLFRPVIGLGPVFAFVLSFSPMTFAQPSTPPPETAPQTKTTDAPKMACPSCKTKPLAEPFHGQWEDSESDAGSFKWFVVGSKHICHHCDGVIAVKHGVITTNTMQSHRPMCGETAALCLAAISRES